MTRSGAKIVLPRWMRRLSRMQDGMSMAEVMVAMLILAAGSLAILNLISSAAHSSFRNEQSQVVSDRLQQEMERIQQLPYEQIALTGLPADSTSTSSPAWRVQGTNYSITHDGTQPAPLVYNGSSLYGGGTVSGGAVDPTPTHFTSGDVGGTVYRYVVWRNDPTCPDSTCPGSQDFKRVIVAITYDTTPTGGTRQYQELFKDLSNPATSPLNDVNPGPACTGGADCNNGSCTGTNCTGGPGCTSGSDCDQGVCTGTDCSYDAIPWTFWLTDTSCDQSSRQPIAGDHLAHSTDGVCSAGTQDSGDCTTNVLGATSCPPGAPDLMVTQAPPLTAETPLWDYATDIEPATGGATDKGLQMPPPSSNGCLSSLFQPLTNVSGALIGDPDTSRMQTIHKWLSPPMGTGFNVALSGTGTLDLWTQSINAASYSGKICFWIFERHLNVFGVPVDTPAVNLASNLTYSTFSQSTWPTGWTELHIPLNFNLSVNLGPNSRLGLGIQVEKAGTGGGGMQFLYDEPSFDSRLQVNTTSLLPF
jgi:hypothetical protein